MAMSIRAQDQAVRKCISQSRLILPETVDQLLVAMKQDNESEDQGADNNKDILMMLSSGLSENQTDPTFLKDKKPTASSAVSAVIDFSLNMKPLRIEKLKNRKPENQKEPKSGPSISVEERHSVQVVNESEEAEKDQQMPI
jgi:hypothetical protein